MIRASVVVSLVMGAVAIALAACEVNVKKTLGPSDQTIRQTDPHDCVYITVPGNLGGTPAPVKTPTPDPCR